MNALYALIACAVAVSSWFAYRAFTAADEPDYMGEPHHSDYDND